MKLLKIYVGAVMSVVCFSSHAVMSLGTQVIQTNAKGQVVGSQNITVNTNGLGIGTALGAQDVIYTGTKNTSNVLSSSALSKAMSAPLAPVVVTAPVTAIKVNPAPKTSTSNLIMLK